METAAAEGGKFGEAIKELMSTGIFSAKEFQRVMTNALNGPDVLKMPSEVQKKLGAVVATLFAQIKAPVGAAKEAGSGGASGTLAAQTEAKAPKIEGDRLAKIGLFIGNGGPALDYARRTAVAVEKIAAQKYTGGHPYMTEQEAVFAI